MKTQKYIFLFLILLSCNSNIVNGQKSSICDSILKYEYKIKLDSFQWQNGFDSDFKFERKLDRNENFSHDSLRKVTKSLSINIIY